MSTVLQTWVQMLNTVAAALATVVLAYLTFRYVRLTGAMVDSMKATRDPAVFVDVEFPDRVLVVLSIGNTGFSPALNIQIELKANAPCLRGNFHDLAVIKEGISYLPPNRTLKFDFGFVDWAKLDENGGTLEFHIVFFNENMQKFSRTAFFNLTQYSGVLFESFRDPNLAVAEAIKDSERSRQMNEKKDRWFLIERRCPVCGEKVAFTAQKCPHCHEFIPKPEVVEGGSDKE